jgi:hypothetical protein
MPQRKLAVVKITMQYYTQRVIYLRCHSEVWRLQGHPIRGLILLSPLASSCGSGGRSKK